MKRIFTLALVLIMALGIFGPAAAAPAAAPVLSICGTATTVTLFAGQHIDAGTVTVSNDANNLYVTFTTSGDWWLDTTHLHVAKTLTGVPTAKNGNPIPGQFDYQTNHDPRVQTYTYEVPWEAIEGFDPFAEEGSKSLVIAAHAALVRIVDGEVVQTETGWGNGPRFVTKGNWGTYIEYEWQKCNGEPPAEYVKFETAYAYGDTDATCFTDLNLAGQTFNNWGWSNGPLAENTYTWDLWAGAGQCNTSKGTLVGSVTVVYSSGTATVTYTMVAPYVLGETQVHVGPERMARNANNEYTSAPGQFGSVHDPSCEDENGDQVFAGCDTDTHTFQSLNGDIYVVAHASVYQPAP